MTLRILTDMIRTQKMDTPATTPIHVPHRSAVGGAGDDAGTDVVR